MPPKVSLESRLEARKRPAGNPIMYQEWRELLFLHWEWEPSEIQLLLPPGLYVDTFDDKAYVGVVPFMMPKIKITQYPLFPPIHDYVELNVRTYVYDKNGIPGVWFFSLDINGTMAAKIARQIFSLPYFFADLIATKQLKEIHISGKRIDTSSQLIFAYQPIDGPFFAEPETLEFFLIERYILFTFSVNQVSLLRVHHSPYPLCQVQATHSCGELFELDDLPLPQPKPDHLIYSKGVDVDIFALEKGS